MPESGNTGNDLGSLVNVQSQESYSRKPSVLIVAHPDDVIPIEAELHRLGYTPENYVIADTEKGRELAAKSDVAITDVFSVSLRAKEVIRPDSPNFKDELRTAIEKNGLYIDNVVEPESNKPVEQPEVKQTRILYVNATNRPNSVQQGLEEKGYGVEKKSFMIEIVYGLLSPETREQYSGTDLVLVTRGHDSYEGIQATYLLQVLAKHLPGVPVIYQTEQEGVLAEPVVEFAGRYNNYKVLTGPIDKSDLFWQIEQLLKEKEAERGVAPFSDGRASEKFRQLGRGSTRKSARRPTSRTAKWVPESVPQKTGSWLLEME
ncbi:hypothetical protein KY361_07085 [Candidatus Woesearchaeota archaeon]|nr:hypothetical protein [Candidatus Woesearchaeota archaeon]